jgi:hypothetical protein
VNPLKQRIAWFSDVQQCRRRSRKHWAATPLSLVFTLADAYQLLELRALCYHIRGLMKVRTLPPSPSLVIATTPAAS